MPDKYMLPLSGWHTTKTKTISLSLNWYRNAHYQQSNKIKKQVHEYLLKYNFKKYEKIKLNIKLYFKDKRCRDIPNFEAVASKFFLDSLVERGSIKDDNYNYYTGYTVDFGGYAKNNYITFEIIEVL